MLAPARMPVAAGKNMENTEKNDSSLLNTGPKFSKKMLALKKKEKTLSLRMFSSLTFWNLTAWADAYPCI